MLSRFVLSRIGVTIDDCKTTIKIIYRNKIIKFEIVLFFCQHSSENILDKAIAYKI